MKILSLIKFVLKLHETLLRYGVCNVKFKQKYTVNIVFDESLQMCSNGN